MILFPRSSRPQEPGFGRCGHARELLVGARALDIGGSQVVHSDKTRSPGALGTGRPGASRVHQENKPDLDINTSSQSKSTAETSPSHSCKEEAPALSGALEAEALVNKEAGQWRPTRESCSSRNVANEEAPAALGGVQGFLGPTLLPGD
jgi:hypothetical protein